MAEINILIKQNKFLLFNNLILKWEVILMKETENKILDFEEYKRKKNKNSSEVDRKELLELLKKYIATK